MRIRFEKIVEALRDAKDLSHEKGALFGLLLARRTLSKVKFTLTDLEENSLNEYHSRDTIELAEKSWSTYKPRAGVYDRYLKAADDLQLITSTFISVLSDLEWIEGLVEKLDEVPESQREAELENSLNSTLANNPKKFEKPPPGALESRLRKLLDDTAIKVSANPALEEAIIRQALKLEIFTIYITPLIDAVGTKISALTSRPAAQSGHSTVQSLQGGAIRHVPNPHANSTTTSTGNQVEYLLPQYQQFFPAPPLDFPVPSQYQQFFPAPPLDFPVPSQYQQYFPAAAAAAAPPPPPQQRPLSMVFDIINGRLHDAYHDVVNAVKKGVDFSRKRKLLKKVPDMKVFDEERNMLQIHRGKEYNKYTVEAIERYINVEHDFTIITGTLVSTLSDLEWIESQVGRLGALHQGQREAEFEDALNEALAEAPERFTRPVEGALEGRLMALVNDTTNKLTKPDLGRLKGMSIMERVGALEEMGDLEMALTRQKLDLEEVTRHIYPHTLALKRKIGLFFAQPPAQTGPAYVAHTTAEPQSLADLEEELEVQSAHFSTDFSTDMVDPPGRETNMTAIAAQTNDTMGTKNPSHVLLSRYFKKLGKKAQSVRKKMRLALLRGGFDDKRQAILNSVNGVDITEDEKRILSEGLASGQEEVAKSSATQKRIKTILKYLNINDDIKHITETICSVLGNLQSIENDLKSESNYGASANALKAMVNNQRRELNDLLGSGPVIRQLRPGQLGTWIKKSVAPDIDALEREISTQSQQAATAGPDDLGDVMVLLGLAPPMGSVAGGLDNYGLELPPGTSNTNTGLSNTGLSTESFSFALSPEKDITTTSQQSSFSTPLVDPPREEDMIKIVEQNNPMNNNEAMHLATQGLYLATQGLRNGIDQIQRYIDTITLASTGGRLVSQDLNAALVNLQQARQATQLKYETLNTLRQRIGPSAYFAGTYSTEANQADNDATKAIQDADILLTEILQTIDWQ